MQDKGVEPLRSYEREILSLLCLPVPSILHFILLVGRTGFEPVNMESKSIMLPLHHLPIFGAFYWNRTNIFCLQGRHNSRYTKKAN